MLYKNPNHLSDHEILTLIKRYYNGENSSLLKNKTGNALLSLLGHVREFALRTELASQHKEYRPRAMDQVELTIW